MCTYSEINTRNKFFMSLVKQSYNSPISKGIVFIEYLTGLQSIDDRFMQLEDRSNLFSFVYIYNTDNNEN